MILDLRRGGWPFGGRLLRRLQPLILFFWKIDEIQEIRLCQDNQKTIIDNQTTHVHQVNKQINYLTKQLQL